MTYSSAKRLIAECVGTLFLLAIVVGSGVMGETLADGNDAVALLGNTLATGAGLVILIMIFGPVSGAHFNPAVTLAFLMCGEIKAGLAGRYVLAQLVGGVLGVFLAHAMFDLAIAQESVKARAGLGQVIGEATATFGLVLTILAVVRSRAEAVPYAVGLYITAGYWFTSSTSFANPAVTLARTLTDTFAGIAPQNAPGFILGQIIGAVLATLFARWLLEAPATEAAQRTATRLTSSVQR